MSRVEKDRLRERIDRVLIQFEDDYARLAQRSERLYEDQKALEWDYKALDRRTGLNALLAELAALHEK